MTKREQELLDRIARLEERIRVLESRPHQEYHYHYEGRPYYRLTQPVDVDKLLKNIPPIRST